MGEEKKMSSLEQAKEMFFKENPDAKKCYEEIQRLQKYIDENPEKVFPKEFFGRKKKFKLISNTESIECPNSYIVETSNIGDVPFLLLRKMGFSFEEVKEEKEIKEVKEKNEYNCVNSCPKCGADGDDEDKIRWDCSIDEEFIKIFPAHCFSCDIDFREIHNIIYSHTEIEEE